MDVKVSPVQEDIDEWKVIFANMARGRSLSDRTPQANQTGSGPSVNVTKSFDGQPLSYNISSTGVNVLDHQPNDNYANAAAFGFGQMMAQMRKRSANNDDDGVVMTKKLRKAAHSQKKRQRQVQKKKSQKQRNKTKKQQQQQKKKKKSQQRPKRKEKKKKKTSTKMTKKTKEKSKKQPNEDIPLRMRDELE